MKRFFRPFVIILTLALCCSLMSCSFPNDNDETEKQIAEMQSKINQLEAKLAQYEDTGEAVTDEEIWARLCNIADTRIMPMYEDYYPPETLLGYCREEIITIDFKECYIVRFFESLPEENRDRYFATFAISLEDDDIYYMNANDGDFYLWDGLTVI